MIEWNEQSSVRIYRRIRLLQFVCGNEIFVGDIELGADDVVVIQRVCDIAEKEVDAAGDLRGSGACTPQRRHQFHPRFQRVFIVGGILLSHGLAGGQTLQRQVGDIEISVVVLHSVGQICLRKLAGAVAIDGEKQELVFGERRRVVSDRNFGGVGDGGRAGAEELGDGGERQEVLLSSIRCESVALFGGAVAEVAGALGVVIVAVFTEVLRIQLLGLHAHKQNAHTKSHSYKWA